MAALEQQNREAPELEDKLPQVESAHLEHSLKAGLSYDEANLVHDFDKKDHERAFRKIDIRLMPMLMALYLIANLDRYVDQLEMKSVQPSI